jgi:hypothetical protein
MMILQWRVPEAAIVTRWRGPEGGIASLAFANPPCPIPTIIGPPGVAGPTGPQGPVVDIIDAGTFN